MRRLSGGHGSEEADARRDLNGNVEISGVGGKRIADAGFNFSQPIVTATGRQYRKGGGQHHHAATDKVGVARPPELALAANGGADLLQDVSDNAGLFGIDFRDAAFKFDLQIDGAFRLDRLTEIYAQRRLQVVKREGNRHLVVESVHLSNIETRFVRDDLAGLVLLRRSDVIRRADVWV